MSRKKGGGGRRAKAPLDRPSAGSERQVRRLDIYRAEAGPRVRWHSPLFPEEWKNALALAAANTALELLVARPERQRFVELGRKLLHSVSQLTEGLVSRGGAGPVACHAGCDHCCHQLVGATPLELLVIFDHLEKARADREDLAARARELARRASLVSPRERYAPEHPCVFLNQGACSIYEVRPLACRGVNALDDSVCRDILHDPLRREAFWSEGRGSPGYVEPSRAVQACSAGLQLALSEVYARSMHPVDLTLAVDLILRSDRDLLTDWLKGLDPFSTVRGGSVQRVAPREPPGQGAPSAPADLGQGAPGVASGLVLGRPDPSSLLSSRWPEDNLLTCFPARHYSGEVVAPVTARAVEHLVQTSLGPLLGLELETGRMGVFTWDLFCKSAEGRMLVQVPRVIDQPGPTGRQKATVPHLSASHIQFFTRRGLRRYLPQLSVPPRTFGQLPVNVLRLERGLRALTFGGGRARIDLLTPRAAWVVELGERLTAEILVEVAAAIAYYYDPAEDGGTTIADLYLNDGDFMLQRKPDGSFSLLLTTIRRREGGVCPGRLLLYLIQLAYYEDFQVGETLLGVPALISNPSVAFAGLCQGRRNRAVDLGEDPERAEAEARGWILGFARSEEGKAYAPWVESFLEGELVPGFGDDQREHWWRLLDIEERLGLCAFQARVASDPALGEQAEELERFRSALEFRIVQGRASLHEERTIPLNDLSLADLSAVLRQAGETPNSATEVGRAIVSKWPFRSFDQLMAEVPRARRLRKLRGRISFGNVVRAEEETNFLLQIDSGLRPEVSSRAERPVANAELFGAACAVAHEVDEAVATFPSFESYMDGALQDDRWGYYTGQVVIGRGGHFITRPEKFSPEYGKWAAVLAFTAYERLRDSGRLGSGEPFFVVEFGAGNGLLAKDLVSAARGSAPHPSLAASRWAEFARVLRYRIYEKSAGLRAKQAALLGDLATVVEGDARRPLIDLSRDFPEGLVGLVLTNEVPDAFGVHKVLLTAAGQALAALVVPRITEQGLLALTRLGGKPLDARIMAVDRSIRQKFSFAQRPGWSYLDDVLFRELMVELSQLELGERERVLLEVSMDEVLVPARCFPSLRAHLARNLVHLAASLAAGKSGVVIYPNAHADRFISELGAALQAGLVVTVDYGADTSTLMRAARRGDFLFRVYCDGPPFRPVPNDPYSRVGLQDLTADVNFTALALAGEEAGLEVLHYGPERDIAGPFLGALLERGAEAELDEFLGSPLFKILVQGRGVSSLAVSPLQTALPVAPPVTVEGPGSRFASVSMALRTDLGTGEG